MKRFFRILSYGVLLFSAVVSLPLHAQTQQPLNTVAITNVSVLTGNGQLIAINVANVGANYTAPPTITITGGAPTTPASAHATIDLTGVVSNVIIDNPGAGYASPPTVTFSPPTNPPSGSLGISAQGTADVGYSFSQPLQNESYGPAGRTIAITAVASGTFPAGGYNIEAFVNGVSIGVSTFHPSSGVPCTMDWAPPQPGAYFLTVKATGIGDPVTSQPIRYHAIGTLITSPTPNTFVPQGSSVAIQATATPTPLSGAGSTDTFVSSIDFYADGALIGSDATAPYSIIYTPAVAPLNHSIEARAFDNNGQQVSPNGTAVQILHMVPPIGTPPTCTISNPATGAVLAIPGNGSPAIPILVSAGSGTGLITKVELYIDGVLFGSNVNFPYVFSWTPTVVGTYRLVALAYDDKSNVVASSIAPVTTVVTVGATPTVSISAPLAGATIGVGGAVTVTASTNDSNVVNGGIAQVVFDFSDGSSAPPVLTPTVPGGNLYSVTWTPKATTGSVSITAVATNKLNLSATSDAVSVNIATGVATNAPPTVSLRSPISGTTVNAGTIINLTAVAADSDGTVTSVTFLANNTVISTSSTLPYTANWIPTAGGSYTVVAQATDNSGNITNSVPVTVNVLPNQSPTVTLASPLSGSTVRVGTSVTVAATAGDIDGTISNVQFVANGVSIGQSTTPPYKVSWTPTADGLYRLVAFAVDNSGAVTASTTGLVIASSVAGDIVYTGTYGPNGAGSVEIGNFAVIASLGKTAAFIAYSTTSGVNKTYFYSGVPVDVSGGYSLVNSSGVTLVAGNSFDTGTTGSFDGGRLTFTGINTTFLGSGSAVASGYYTGSITGHASSALAAIVGSDGSIMLYVSDGSFNDAGGGGLAGKVSASGTFSVSTVRGNRFSGTVDPTTRLLTGTLSGSSGGAFTGAPAILGVSTTSKVSGAGVVYASNLTAPNGNTYDQVLLTGSSATITADPGKVTRLSYQDLTGDIVQVEFAGAGALSITLDNASGPAPAANYNQPNVSYMRGHAGIVISGANESTNVSVFSVGRLTAFDPTGAFNSLLPISATNNPANNANPLFTGHPASTYDGVADIGYLAIMPTVDGKFGGIRTANASYFATTGVAGILAPGVQFTKPVYVGDINASDAASAMLLLGSANDVQVNGGDLLQTNGKAVQVGGISQLKFVGGTTSQGTALPAQADKSRLVEQNGADVTAQVVVNPSP